MKRTTIKEVKQGKFKLVHSEDDSGKQFIELLVEEEDGVENFEYTPFSGYQGLDYDEVLKDAIEVYKKSKK